MKYTLIIVAALLLSPSIYAEQIQWLGYKEARALKSEKPLFVFAKMRFCGTCSKMEKNEFTDPELVKLLNTEFIPVKETINFAFSSFAFDDLQDADGEQLTFKGFPAVMVVEGSKYMLTHGYKDAEQLTKMLSNHY